MPTTDNRLSGILNSSQFDFGVLTSRSWKDRVGRRDPEDLRRFVLQQPSQLNIVYPSNVTFKLYTLKDQWKGKERKALKQIGNQDFKLIPANKRNTYLRLVTSDEYNNLDAGVYFSSVSRQRGNVPYQVTLSATQVSPVLPIDTEIPKATSGLTPPSATQAFPTLPIDTEAPIAVLNPISLPPNGATLEFSVTYSDNSGLSPTTFDDNDIVVVAPNGSLLKATRKSVNGNTVTYSIVAPSGTWDVGEYSVQLQANQVSDTSGNSAAAASLDKFQVNTTSAQGELNIAIRNVPAPADSRYYEFDFSRPQKEGEVFKGALVQSILGFSGTTYFKSDKLLTLADGTTIQPGDLISFRQENDIIEYRGILISEGTDVLYVSFSVTSTDSPDSLDPLKTAVLKGVSIRASEFKDSLPSLRDGSSFGSDLSSQPPFYILNPSVINYLLADLSPINNVLGNPVDNIITGNNSNNELAGLEGDDRLDGGAGNDELYGGVGNDTLLGGSGNDLLVGFANNNNDIAMEGASEIDVLIGGAGNDTFTLKLAFPNYITPYKEESSGDGYALIQDLEPGDKIKLPFEQIDLGVISGVGGPNLETEIYVMSNGTKNRIAVIQDVTITTLESPYFVRS